MTVFLHLFFAFLGTLALVAIAESWRHSTTRVIALNAEVRRALGAAWRCHDPYGAAWPAIRSLLTKDLPLIG